MLLYLLAILVMVLASAFRLVVDTICFTRSFIMERELVSRDSSSDLRLSMAPFSAPTASSTSLIPSMFSRPSIRFTISSW